MPVIKVWCLPDVDEPKLNALHQSIVRAVASVEELGVKDENDITCLFPPDMMKYGLGSEIIVEVTGLFAKPERTDEVRQRLAERLGQAVKGLFPDTHLVECFVYPFNPAQGFWTSRAATAIDQEQRILLGSNAVDVESCTLHRLPSGWHEITFSSEGRSALLEVRRWGAKLFHVAFRSGDAVVSEKGVVNVATYTSINVDPDTPIGELLHKHFRFKE